MPALYPSSVAPEDFKIGDSVKRYVNELSISPYVGKVVTISPKTYKVWVCWPIGGTEQHGPEELILVPKEQGLSLVNHDNGYDSYDKQLSAKSFGVLTPAGRMRLAKVVARKFAAIDPEAHGRDMEMVDAIHRGDQNTIHMILSDNTYTPGKDVLVAALKDKKLDAFYKLLEKPDVSADDEVLVAAVGTGEEAPVHKILVNKAKFTGDGYEALKQAILSKNRRICDHLLKEHKDLYKDLGPLAAEFAKIATDQHMDDVAAMLGNLSNVELIAKAASLSTKFANKLADDLYGKVASLKSEGKSQMEAYAATYDAYGDSFGDTMVREAVLKVYE